MKSTLLRIYDKYILEHPILTLIITFAVLVFFAFQVPKFKLDASGDSLVLENDADLHYHRQITEQYQTKELLVMSYTARGDLFAASTLEDLAKLRDELRILENVNSVTTILDVPLLLGSDVYPGDLSDEKNIKTLENYPVDKSTVLAEFNNNPFYRGRLVSSDGKTTAILINLPLDETYRFLLKRRYELREKKNKHEISAGEMYELEQVTDAYRQELIRLMQRDNRLVEDVRTVMDRHREKAEIYLGGVPMIVADMIAFIKNDLLVFGVGVLFFLIITLGVIFRKLRWVILSMLCCLSAVLVMVGTLGLVDWRVTVISSNFISLMLIKEHWFWKPCGQLRCPASIPCSPQWLPSPLFWLVASARSLISV